jgi:hypothetical protein
VAVFGTAAGAVDVIGFLALGGLSPHIFGQLVCGLTESDTLLPIITTLKEACMPSQSLRLVTGNDVHGNTEL